jgi:pyruvate kinase
MGEWTGETKIGCSYAKLCSSVKEGSNILVADGTLSIKVKAILSDTELLGECLNNKCASQLSHFGTFPTCARQPGCIVPF